jgi:hypothetical protein
MIEQHNLLNRVADLIDAGTLKTTVGEHFGTINAANLRRAHALLESGKVQGQDCAGRLLADGRIGVARAGATPSVKLDPCHKCDRIQDYNRHPLRHIFY